MTFHSHTAARRTGEHLVSDEVNAAAREQVTAVVRALARARWRQIFLDCASAAAFGAVLASIVAVAAIRLGWLSLSPWFAVLGLLSVALAAATAIACVRRPDDLEVAIDADLKLNLKQRLSTAWEFMSNDAGSDTDVTIGRLAAQAVKARLPARSRAGQVFALRANAFAMMTPVAVIALILFSIVDLDFAGRVSSADSDEMVISEGVRLRDYGRRMQARARQRGLARSDEQSLRVQELGNRMQSGALARGEALSRLRDLDNDLDRERRAALNQGNQTAVGPLSIQTSTVSAQPRGMSVHELLQQILDGRIKPSSAASQMLDSDPSALSRHGISGAQIRDALERFEAGDRKALEDMVDKISRDGRSVDDANELRNAREQVARARESLGDKNARSGDDKAGSAGASKASTDGTASDDERGAMAALDDEDGEDGSSMPGARGTDSQRQRERQASNRKLGINENGPLLQADALLGDGAVFVSEARVLPRAGNTTVDNASIDARYVQQLEQVLSNEQYPLHYKEFIRRYFLNLSEGVRAPRAEPLPGQPENPKDPEQ